MSNELSAIERGHIALKEMTEKSLKVTKNSVAKRASFSHTNFRKPEFADLRDAIEEAELNQKLKKQSENVKSLKMRVLELETKLKETKEELKQSNSKESEEIIYVMTKLAECYRLNDQLKNNNIDLKNQLMHQMGGSEKIIRVDEKTGEVISAIFDKK